LSAIFLESSVTVYIAIIIKWEFSYKNQAIAQQTPRDFPVEPAESNITEDNKLEVILPNGIILRMPIHAGSS
jgi:hypothetical protein